MIIEKITLRIKSSFLFLIFTLNTSSFNLNENFIVTLRQSQYDFHKTKYGGSFMSMATMEPNYDLLLYRKLIKVLKVEKQSQSKLNLFMLEGRHHLGGIYGRVWGSGVDIRYSTDKHRITIANFCTNYQKYLQSYIIMKPFEKWKTQEVKQTFGLKEVDKSRIV